MVLSADPMKESNPGQKVVIITYQLKPCLRQLLKPPILIVDGLSNRRPKQNSSRLLLSFADELSVGNG
jgi:hypothetical protein